MYLNQQRGLMVALFSAASSKSSMKKLAIMEKRRSHGYSVSLFVELPIETEEIITSGHGGKVCRYFHQSVGKRE
jgi:hypothetical protein